MTKDRGMELKIPKNATGERIVKNLEKVPGSEDQLEW